MMNRRRQGIWLLCAFLVLSATYMYIANKCSSVQFISGFVRGVNRHIARKAGVDELPMPENVTPTDFIPIVDRKLKFPSAYPIVTKCKSLNETVCKLLTHGVLNKSERHAFLDLLHVIDDVSNKMNWTYFMISGTLFGSWRHHGLIPWDRDADIFMDVSQRDELLRVFSGSDYTPKKMFHPTYLVKFHNIYATHLWESNDIGRMRWPYVDIAFYTGNTTHVWEIDPPGRSGFFFPRSDIFPLHKRPLEGMDLYAPKESLKILQKTYSSSSRGICKSEYASVQCSELEGLVPFVHRQFINGTMEEKLMYGGKVLSTKYIEEKKEDVTEPYSLVRKSG